MAATTTVGRVALTVGDLAATRDFYERVLGLTALEAGEGRSLLGAGDRALVELVEDRDAPVRPPRTTGLFHLAILVPDRAELARSLRRAIAAGWRLQGASDHLVSEALYLADPEGNGIEVYRDRPREQWRRDGDELRMATLPLDLEDLLGEPDPVAGPDAGVADGTRIGHVHLDVADLTAAERFYAGPIGLAVTARGYPGALFLAAGGYHHHLGLNTWRAAGGPPPAGARGLREFELELPDADALTAVGARLRDGGAQVDPADDAAVAVADPSGSRLRLAAQR